MSCVLTVRVLPRRGTTLRAALATLEVLAVLAVGHLWAGGALPSVLWLGAMAAVLFGAGCLVLHDRVRPLVATPALVATQLLLHAWLSTLSAGAGGMAEMDHAAAGHSAATHPVLDPRMLVVHVVGGLLTAVLWQLRARVADVVVTFARQPLPPLPWSRGALVAVPAPPARSLHVLDTAPHRGPPLLVPTA